MPDGGHVAMRGPDPTARRRPANRAASKAARGALGGAPETLCGAEGSLSLMRGDHGQNARVVSRVPVDVVVAVAI
jgi:hypothetical protein